MDGEFECNPARQSGSGGQPAVISSRVKHARPATATALRGTADDVLTILLTVLV